MLVSVVAVAPVIVGMVEFIKKFGVEGKALTLSAFGVGVLIALLGWAYTAFPSAQMWITAVFIAIVGGMVATGLYDFTNKRFPKVEK